MKRGGRLMLVLCIGGCTGTFRFSELEVAVHDGINDYRISQGLNALELHPDVGAPARAHSDDMLSGVVAFGHDGFEARADEILSSIVGTRGVGENVAMNQGYSDPVGVAIEGWLDSPGHLANIEGDWTWDGVGVAGTAEQGWYLTQMFAE